MEKDELQTPLKKQPSGKTETIRADLARLIPVCETIIRGSLYVFQTAPNPCPPRAGESVSASAKRESWVKKWTFLKMLEKII